MTPRGSEQEGYWTSLTEVMTHCLWLPLARDEHAIVLLDEKNKTKNEKKKIVFNEPPCKKRSRRISLRLAGVERDSFFRCARAKLDSRGRESIVNYILFFFFFQNYFIPLITVFLLLCTKECRLCIFNKSYKIFSRTNYLSKVVNSS